MPRGRPPGKQIGLTEDDPMLKGVIKQVGKKREKTISIDPMLKVEPEPPKKESIKTVGRRKVKSLAPISSHISSEPDLLPLPVIPSPPASPVPSEHPPTPVKKTVKKNMIHDLMGKKKRAKSADTPLRGGGGIYGDDYLESQKSLQCGMHAINNLLQKKKVVKSDLDAFLLMDKGNCNYIPYPGIDQNNLFENSSDTVLNEIFTDEIKELVENDDVLINIVAFCKKYCDKCDTKNAPCNSSYENYTEDFLSDILKNMSYSRILFINPARADDLPYSTVDGMYQAIIETVNNYIYDFAGLIINRNENHWTALTSLTKHCTPDKNGNRFRYIDSFNTKKSSEMPCFKDISGASEYIKNLKYPNGNAVPIPGIIAVFRPRANPASMSSPVSSRAGSPTTMGLMGTGYSDSDESSSDNSSTSSRNDSPMPTWAGTGYSSPVNQSSPAPSPVPSSDGEDSDDSSTNTHNDDESISSSESEDSEQSESLANKYKVGNMTIGPDFNTKYYTETLNALKNNTGNPKINIEDDKAVIDNFIFTYEGDISNIDSETEFKDVEIKDINGLSKVIYKNTTRDKSVIAYYGPNTTLLYNLVSNRIILNGIYNKLSNEVLDYLKSVKIIYNIYDSKKKDLTDYNQIVDEYKNCMFIYYANFGNSGLKGGIGGGSAAIGNRDNAYGIVSGDIMQDKTLLSDSVKIKGKNVRVIEHIISQINEVFSKSKERDYKYIMLPAEINVNEILMGSAIFAKKEGIEIIRRFVFEMFASFIPLSKWINSTELSNEDKVILTGKQHQYRGWYPPAPAPAPDKNNLIKSRKTYLDPPPVCEDNDDTNIKSEKCDFINVNKISNNDSINSMVSFLRSNENILDKYIDYFTNGEEEMIINKGFECFVARNANGELTTDKIKLKANSKIVKNGDDFYIKGETRDNKIFTQNASFCYVPKILEPDVFYITKPNNILVIILPNTNVAVNYKVEFNGETKIIGIDNVNSISFENNKLNPGEKYDLKISYDESSSIIKKIAIPKEENQKVYDILYFSTFAYIWLISDKTTKKIIEDSLSGTMNQLKGILEQGLKGITVDFRFSDKFFVYTLARILESPETLQYIINKNSTNIINEYISYTNKLIGIVKRYTNINKQVEELFENINETNVFLTEILQQGLPDLPNNELEGSLNKFYKNIHSLIELVNYINLDIPVSVKTSQLKNPVKLDSLRNSVQVPTSLVDFTEWENGKDWGDLAAPAPASSIKLEVMKWYNNPTNYEYKYTKTFGKKSKEVKVDIETGNYVAYFNSQYLIYLLKQDGSKIVAFDINKEYPFTEISPLILIKPVLIYTGQDKALLIKSGPVDASKYVYIETGKYIKYDDNIYKVISIAKSGDSFATMKIQNGVIPMSINEDDYNKIESAPKTDPIDTLIAEYNNITDLIQKVEKFYEIKDKVKSADDTKYNIIANDLKEKIKEKYSEYQNKFNTLTKEQKARTKTVKEFNTRYNNVVNAIESDDFNDKDDTKAYAELANKDDDLENIITKLIQKGVHVAAPKYKTVDTNKLCFEELCLKINRLIYLMNAHGGKYSRQSYVDDLNNFNSIKLTDDDGLDKDLTLLNEDIDDKLKIQIGKKLEGFVAMMNGYKNNVDNETDVDDDTKNAYKNAMNGAIENAQTIIDAAKLLSGSKPPPIPVLMPSPTQKLVKLNKSKPDTNKPPAVCTDGASPDSYTEDKCDYIKPIDYSNNLIKNHKQEFTEWDIRVDDSYNNMLKIYNDEFKKGVKTVKIDKPFTCKVATYGKGEVLERKGGKLVKEQKDRVFIEDFHLLNAEIVNKNNEIYVVGNTVDGKSFYQSAEFCYKEDDYKLNIFNKRNPNLKEFIGKFVDIQVVGGRLIKNVKVKDFERKENFILLVGLKDGKAYTKDITDCIIAMSASSAASVVSGLGDDSDTDVDSVTLSSTKPKNKNNSPISPGPRPPKKPIAATYQQTITIDSIKSNIEKYGYTFIRPVPVERDDGISVDFIKAYDGNGYTVYITLNGFGGSLLLTSEYMAEQSKLKASAKTRISAAIRNAAAASKRDSVIVKGPEICTIVHKDNGDCVENFFTCIDDKSNSESNPDMIENGIEESIPIQYPIISYFEIAQNLSGVMDLSKKFYDEQMKRIFDETQKKLDEAIKDADFLSFAIKSFNDNRDLAFNSLKNERNKIASNFKSNLKDEDDKKMQKRHACNMQSRNEIYENYIRVTHRFNNYTTIVKGLTAKIVDLNNKIVDEHNKYHNADMCSNDGVLKNTGK